MAPEDVAGPLSDSVVVLVDILLTELLVLLGIRELDELELREDMME